ncbi:DUF2264 domain-containing protein [Puniceicoccales bacterium CK1056]|uniref:DUF2264 domain-containing protein n=1 Tax=Oceanipulchritudo coccoides TaxID=2706888 RepID=A0A6B2M385_9BACT|nr:DUF2264 domain-containing protein [Oceanipulchritudo coccoides]NDV62265.1 DUF2264 domain-containing protein [Oceanipulchritudo coccoides]
MKLPADYVFWQESAEQLVDALMALADPEGSEIPLSGKASDHDANADRLEAFTRPCLLSAFWLQSLQHGNDSGKRERVASWLRQALLRGTDPESPCYWGPNTNYHQNGVEIGLLASALLLAREYLWNPFSDEEKYQVSRYIATNRATGHVWNNHFYFGLLALEFLREIGMDRPADAASIESWFSEMEGMYRSQGWFMDGVNQSYDHYNAYAFHFYGLLWSHLFGHTNPERKARWCGWAGEFLDEYQHVFAASGEHPAFGRSITYRFNACAPFPLAALLGVSPLSAGRARRLCNRNLRFFLEKPIYQEQGAIGIGWTDVFPELSEGYSCAGSVYWASKAFSALLLPPDHPFWVDAEEPLASEEGEYVRVQKDAGLVFRSIDGEVEILNAGTEISPMNMTKFGPWKWGKLAYRTGMGFQIGHQGEYYNKFAGWYSRDGGLTMEGGSDTRIHGRHYTQPFELDKDHLSCTYALGDKLEQLLTIVETSIWWNKGWLLEIHWTDAYQPVLFTLGGYALPSREAQSFKRKSDGCIHSVATNSRYSALQPLLGFEGVLWDERTDDDERRSHVQAPYHVTPLAQTGKASGERVLAALVYGGNKEEEAKPWECLSIQRGKWILEHPSLGNWTITHSALPSLNL